MDSTGQYSHNKKSKQTESGFQMFLKDNSENVHADHPNLTGMSSIKYLNNQYNQLPASEKQIYASRAASQNQISTIPSKKKKGLPKPVDGSQNNPSYISQANSSNYTPQESQQYSVISSMNINQYSQQNAHSQVSNSPRQYITSNYQSISSNLPAPLQSKSSQSVTPKKRITTPIKSKQESESSDSDDESDTTFHLSSSTQPSRRVKIPSIYSKQVQTQNQNQMLQSNYYYNQQPQVNQNYSSQQQQKIKQKPKSSMLPTPYPQSQSIQDHRLQYDQNDPKRYFKVNLNSAPGQAPIINDSYAFPQINQMNTQRPQDPKFYHDIEMIFDDENSSPSREEEMARNLLNEFDLKSNMYFSISPYDCNCLENYPISFIGK